MRESELRQKKNNLRYKRSLTNEDFPNFDGAKTGTGEKKMQERLQRRLKRNQCPLASLLVKGLVLLTLMLNLILNRKGLAKLGTIVAETLFLVMFPGWLN